MAHTLLLNISMLLICLVKYDLMSKREIYGLLRGCLKIVMEVRRGLAELSLSIILYDVTEMTDFMSG